MKRRAPTFEKSEVGFRLTPVPKPKPKPHTTFTKNRYWADAVKVGALGRIKQTSSTELAGQQVVYLGKWRKQPWVKLITNGQAFPYMLKWVDWE